MKKILTSIVLLTAFALCSNKGLAETSHSVISSDSIANVQTVSVISVQNTVGAHGIACIYLESGKKLNQYFLTAGKNNIDIAGLAHGTYVLSIMKEGGLSYNQKFTK